MSSYPSQQPPQAEFAWSPPTAQQAWGNVSNNYQVPNVVPQAFEMSSIGSNNNNNGYQLPLPQQHDMYAGTQVDHRFSGDYRADVVFVNDVPAPEKTVAALEPVTSRSSASGDTVVMGADEAGGPLPSPRSFLRRQNPETIVDAAARLVELLQNKHMEKDTESILREILPDFKLPPSKYFANLELKRENIRAILDAGFEQFLERVKAKTHEATPFEIRLRNLSYIAEVQVKESSIETVGSSLLNMIWPFGKKKIVNKYILNNLNDIIAPGSLTLVLGLPGSGKTSFLRALSGSLYRDAKSKLTGELLINGERNAGNLYMKRLASYVEQRETHLPLLTTRETLEFARDCLLFAVDEVKDLHDTRVDMLLHMLGLHHAGDTLVGNEMVRGVSGGERRRVTLAEMMTGPQRIMCLDEISTGLDSAATFDITNALRLMAHVLRLTVVVALLQPLPDTFSLFDEVILLNKGNIIFHGPAAEAEAHFATLGFIRSERADMADFLLELTGQDAAALFHPRRPDEMAPSVEDMVEAWKQHPRYRSMMAALDQPSMYPPAKDKLSLTQYTREFALTTMQAIPLCFKRQVTLTKRSIGFVNVKLAQAVIMGLISGSLFYDMAHENFQLRYGFIFFAALTMCLGHLASVPVVFNEKAVFFKQNRANFMGAAPFLLATSIFEWPVILLETTVFTLINYWMAGLSNSEHNIHYGVFWLLIVLCSVTMNSFYRFIAFSTPNLEAAQTLAGLATVVSAVFAGFMIPRTQIPDYYIWIYYLSPLAWGLRALAINEFKSDTFDITLPSGENQGNVFLDAFDFFHGKEWIWIGVGVLIGMYVILLALSYLALRVSKFGAPQSVENARPPPPPALPESLPTVRLPFEPITFAFSNIKYTVDVSKGRQLTLLNGVSGYARPGTITALMGSSGAGKTTLLDVLSGRKNTGMIEGDILLNGYAKEAITFSRVSGYVEQMDVHSSTATVREALIFSARLRLPSEVSKADVLAFVEQVIDVLDLRPIADRLVGSKDTGGLSTEQMKRLTIGVELVANPSLIFLDEPTSGLDSRGAAIVMRAIKNVAKTGRTIICTIHQPSTELFEMFDRLLLLQRGGHVTYFGDLGPHCRTLIDYFESIPGTPKCKPDENPASYMLDAIGAGVGRGVKADYATVYASSALSIENDRVLQTLVTPIAGTRQITFTSRYAQVYATQFAACLEKNMRSYWRMPEYNLVRSLFLIVMALLFGSLYYKNDPTTQTGAFARISVMFISSLFIGVVNMNTVISVVMKERSVYYRERASGLYSPSVYAIANGIVEIPYQIFNSLVFCSIFYFMVGFKASAANFFFYFLNFWLFTMMCTFFGQLVAAIAPGMAVAQALAPIFISLWNMFCGYLTPKPDIPNGWIWLYWLSPLRYLLEAIIVDQFHCDDVDCFSVTTIVGNGEYTTTLGEDFVHDSFGMHYDNRWLCVLALIIFIVVFRFLTGVVLAKVVHGTR